MPTQPTFHELKIANPVLEGNNRTYLTSDISTSDSILNVISTSGEQFLTSGLQDYYVLIEDYGREKAEIVLIDADDVNTTDTSLKTLSTLKFSHETSDAVTFIPYNKINIYGLTESGGTRTLIDTIDIDPTENYTKYRYEGLDYSIFVIAYYNSNDDEISSFSEEIQTSSFGRTSAKQVIESALKKAMTTIDESADSKLNWDVAIQTLNDGLDEIMLEKKKWLFLHTVSTGQTTTKKQSYIDFPSDLAILEHVIIDNNTLDWISRLTYDTYTKSGTVNSYGLPKLYTIKNNKIYLYPTPDQEYDIIYEYYKYPSEITELNDSVDRQFVPLLKYYCAAHFAWIRGNEKRGDKMYNLFTNKLQKQIEDYSGPDQSGDAESIEILRWGNLDNDYLI